MLRIQGAQMAVFARNVERRFVTDTMAHLRAHHESRTAELSDERLEQLVRSGIAQARTAGLSWYSSITLFVALTVEIGHDFHHHPAIALALHDPRYSPDECIERAVWRLPAAVWEQAAQATNSSSNGESR